VNEQLLSLAGRLRAAAVDADRPDVVAKVDDVILLIAGENRENGEGGEGAGTSKADAVLRLLNGLGF
jgi:hypothetical protein